MVDDMYRDIVDRVKGNLDIQKLDKMLKSYLDTQHQIGFSEIKRVSREVVRKYLKDISKTRIDILVEDIKTSKLENLKTTMHATYFESGWVFTDCAIEYDACRAIIDYAEEINTKQSKQKKDKEL